MSRPGRPKIDPTAVVSSEAHLDDDVEIGPLCVVGPGVHLGRGTRLIANAVVLGPCSLGPGNVVHPGAVLGGEPQDRSYHDEPTTLAVGEGNVFREHVTVNRGTTKDRGETRIGSHGLFLAGSHVAHDCQVGDHVTLTNGTLLGGHVVIEDHVVTGGHVAVAPFVRLGEACFLAGGAMVERDVPPFVIAAGDRARVRALNRVGLLRCGVPEASVEALEKAFRQIFRAELPRATAASKLESDAIATDPYVRKLLKALEAERIERG